MPLIEIDGEMGNTADNTYQFYVDVLIKVAVDAYKEYYNINDESLRFEEYDKTDKKVSYCFRVGNQIKKIPKKFYFKLIEKADYEIAKLYYTWGKNGKVIERELERFNFTDYMYFSQKNRKICNIVEWGETRIKIFKKIGVNNEDLISYYFDINENDEEKNGVINRKLYYMKNDCLQDEEFIVHKESYARGSGGAMRADRVEEVNYRWTGDLALGLALGLDRKKYLNISQNNYKLYRNINIGLFLKTNVPCDSTRKIWTTKTKNNMGSEIQYYKQFKKADQVTRKNKPDKPSPPKIINLKEENLNNMQDYDSYFNFHGYEVAKLFLKKYRKYMKGKEDKSGLPINSGTVGLRKSAGSVMKEYYETDQNFWNDFSLYVGGKPSYMSATLFAKYVVDKKFVIGIDKVIAPQEWCHLYGHGDGGDETFDNFVSGSKHCNTEQLAIECGQRKGRCKDLKVKVTAYLYPNLKNYFHLAQVIRYKIYYKDKKIFDHVYDAQSESFDYNEFKILKTTVERVIAVAQGSEKATEYENSINEKLVKYGYEQFKYKLNDSLKEQLQ